jgi:predicted ribonuclease YlaK
MGNGRRKKAKEGVEVWDTSAIIAACSAANPEEYFLGKTFLKENGAKKIIVPFKAFEELDGFKSEESIRGVAARRAYRILKVITKEKRFRTKADFELNINGLEFIVEIDDTLVKPFINSKKGDNYFLSVAKRYATEHEGESVTLVCNDGGMSTFASLIGIETREHSTIEEVVTKSRAMTGIYRYRVGEKVTKILEALARKGKRSNGIPRGRYFRKDELHPNEYIEVTGTITAETGGNVGRRGASGRAGFPERITRVVQYKPSIDQLVEVKTTGREAFGIHSRDLEQELALDLLLDPEIKLVILDGTYGSGKSLLAIAAGLEQLNYHDGKNPVDAKRKAEEKQRRLKARLGTFEGVLETKKYSLDIVSRKEREAQATMFGDMFPNKTQKVSKVGKEINKTYFTRVLNLYLEREGEILTETNVAGTADLHRNGYETFTQLWEEIAGYFQGKYETARDSCREELGKVEDALKGHEDTTTGVERIYDEMHITRALVASGGAKIGALPGGIKGKAAPYLRGFYDNLKFLLRRRYGHTTDVEKKISAMEAKGAITIELSEIIRGASIANSYMIIDEAQNLTPDEVETLITRMAEGSKVVLCGDLGQIDRRFMTAATSGFSDLITRLSRKKTYQHADKIGYMLLPHAHRGVLSQLANDLYR